MTFTWRDSYSTGSAAIDAEHKHLFRLANDFFEATDRLKRTEYAVSLFAYAREHFSHEEALMQEISYPAIAQHFEQHKQLIAKFNEVVECSAQDALNSTDLKSFLTGWLVGHIVTFDTKLSAYVIQTNGEFKGIGPV